MPSFLSEISIFDLIVCSLIIILGAKGVINGFIKEIFGLVGIIGGVILAIKFADFAGEYISQNFYKLDSMSAKYFLGFLAVLFGFWLICIIVGLILSKIINLSGLGFLDRLFGFLIGSAKIFLIFAIIVVVLSQIKILNTHLKPYFDKSFTYPYLLDCGKWLMNFDRDVVIEEIQKHGILDKNSTKGDTNETRDR